MKEDKIHKLIFSIFIVFFIIGVFYKITKISNENKQNYVTYGYDKKLEILSSYTDSDINNKNINNFKLKIVDTDNLRRDGLSNTKILCNECAMLFIFGKEGIYPFWMKDMNYDLDIIYIKEVRSNLENENKLNKKIISEIFENVKVSSYPSSIRNSVSASYVLEVNNGKVKELNIRVGDEVNF